MVEWAKKHYGDSSRALSIMGNSVGGVNVAKIMLSPLFKDVRYSVSLEGKAGIRWKGAITVAAPFHYNRVMEQRYDLLKAYYRARVQADSALRLLKASPEAAQGSPKVLVMYATLDPQEEIIKPNLDFIEEWRKTRREDLDVKLLDGYNHVSPVLAIGTGKSEQEARGNMVAQWMAQVEAERTT